MRNFHFLKSWWVSFLPVVILFFVLSIGCNDKACNVENVPKSGRAVSLKILQQQLQEYGTPNEWPQLLETLCGLKRIDGYIMDKSNNDVILFGQTDLDLPPLHLEDLIVAMRNAWMKYLVLEDGKHYYESPGCSIDPDPIVFKSLDKVADDLDIRQDTVFGLERWHEVCENPQLVRVMGVPFNSRFAAIMVESDYFMKRLVDGSAVANDFVSLMDLTEARMRQDFENDPSNIATNVGMNRFWFSPGENTYAYDSHMVVIGQCPVTLLTEKEHLGEENKFESDEEQDPLAEQFALQLTEKYKNLAEEHRIYYELENLFRFVALAKIMKHEQVTQWADLNFLIDNAPIHHFDVNRNLPGVSNAKEIYFRKEFPESTLTQHIILPICGGVGIDIQVDNKSLQRDFSHQIEVLQRSVIALRPALTVLFWDVVS